MNEFLISGELSPDVTDLVQEAYDAALYHVWRSSAPITCYMVASPYYGPESAEVLIQQAEILNRAAGNIDPETLAKARAAIEHDMAFYALSDTDVQALYDRLFREAQANNQPVPVFDDLDLVLTSNAKTAAQFIVDILTGK